MAYSSDGMKKEYEKQCREQRKLNLIKLRGEIAKMTQAEFQKTIGFTKNDLSMLENGDKTLSLFHIHAYKTYFLEHHSINVSVDFLMGYTDILENQVLNIGKETGLSNDAIEMLKTFVRRKNISKDIMPGIGADIDAINIMLEYEYQKEKNAGGYIPSWSIFHYIKQYLSSGVYEREIQDRLRICDGKIWVDINEKADALIHNGKEYRIEKMEAINNESGGGNNPKTMNVYNTDNPKDRYVVEVDKVFQSYSRDNILDELKKIKDYLEEKKGK